MTSICWSSSCFGQTVVNIGSQALAMHSNDVISFFDIKTRNISFYKADNCNVGIGVSVLAGHNRLPVYAFSESTLRSSVFVQKYPDMTNYVVFPARGATTYSDMRFSETDYLVAITGYPFYKIRLWNFRIGQLLVELETNRKCAKCSLLCSNTNIPMIIFYSPYIHQILVWEMSMTLQEAEIQLTSKINLPYEEYERSILHNMTFGDDGILYIINDKGILSSVEIAQFYLKKEWTFPDVDIPCAFFVYVSKLGLLVRNSDIIYFIKRKAKKWLIEYTIDDLRGGIEKMIYNYNNEIYAANDVGNIYRVQVNDELGRFVDFDSSRFKIMKYLMLRGVREENLIVLTGNFEIRLVDILRMSTISSIVIKNATTVASHNQLPGVVVGTTDGLIYYLSYENIRDPVILKIITVYDNVGLICSRLWDNTTIMQDEYHNLHLLRCDFKQSDFYKFAIFKKDSSYHTIEQYYLCTDGAAVIFVNTEREATTVNINRLILIFWSFDDNYIQQRIYPLQKVYSEFSTLSTLHKDFYEFIGARKGSIIFDVFRFTCSDNSLIHLSSVQTCHNSHIFQICGIRNLVTCSVSGVLYNLRTHKRSNKLYGMCRSIMKFFCPRIVKRFEEVYSGKYLVNYCGDNNLIVAKLPTLTDNLMENTILAEPNLLIKPLNIFNIPLDIVKSFLVKEFTMDDKESRLKIDARIDTIQKLITDLIDYDMSVTGKTTGIYRKFCLNYVWLDRLYEEANLLCKTERTLIMNSITEQSRIRDWIMSLINQSTIEIGFKLRSLFSNSWFECYPLVKWTQGLLTDQEYYRFYDLEELAVFLGEEGESNENDAVVKDNETVEKNRKRFIIEGSAYEHVNAKEFHVQDINDVTANQINNAIIKYRTVVNDALMKEFNKMFNETRNLKSEIINSILGTNVTLNKIYDNMNIMLRLLEMDEFIPEQISVPQWMADEIVDRILTVDDSELKAINRRKKKDLGGEGKRGRMLLWSVEFWIHALMIMMDGVLEKLWEEEIKKDIPIPEFILKKDPHDYTLEDQRRLREYEEKVRQLEADRRKYLRILGENEVKTKTLKDNFILKINEKCAEMALNKLKYDFAIRQNMLRMLNLRITHSKRIYYLKQIAVLREDILRLNNYTLNYLKLSEFWETTVGDTRMKLDNLKDREKTIERNFRSSYLAIVPQQLVPELKKIYKKYPRPSPKSFNTKNLCFEVAARLLPKPGQNFNFPLPQDVFDYLESINLIDSFNNAPSTLEQKHWEHLVKLRRSKIETELKMKGLGFQLIDAQNARDRYNRETQSLKQMKNEQTVLLNKTIRDYIENIQNQVLQVTLNLGQVEVKIGGSLKSLKHCVLMNVDDINEVNNMIKNAGSRKLNAMQRVAIFRRQVIYKEWEHKVVRANIDYMNYMLKVIEKCKITTEFLSLLRNWEKSKTSDRKMRSAVGLIERKIDEKVTAFQKQLEIIDDNIDKIKLQIEVVKRANREVNLQIGNIKVNIALNNARRDTMVEEKRTREQKRRIAAILRHANLIDKVRRDYVHLLELKTLLELQYIRTYPILDQAPQDCPSFMEVVE